MLYLPDAYPHINYGLLPEHIRGASMIEVKTMTPDESLGKCALCESILLPKVLFLVHASSQAGPIHTIQSNFNFSVCLPCVTDMQLALEDHK